MLVNMTALFYVYFVLCISIARCLVLPNDIVSIYYGQLPLTRTGFDGRFGLGYRFGRFADFQKIIELGPQTKTRKIGTTSAPPPAASPVINISNITATPGIFKNQKLSIDDIEAARDSRKNTKLVNTPNKDMKSIISLNKKTNNSMNMSSGYQKEMIRPGKNKLTKQDVIKLIATFQLRHINSYQPKEHIKIPSQVYGVENILTNSHQYAKIPESSLHDDTRIKMEGELLKSLLTPPQTMAGPTYWNSVMENTKSDARIEIACTKTQNVDDLGMMMPLVSKIDLRDNFGGMFPNPSHGTIGQNPKIKKEGIEKSHFDLINTRSKPMYIIAQKTRTYTRTPSTDLLTIMPSSKIVDSDQFVKVLPYPTTGHVAMIKNNEDDNLVRMFNEAKAGVFETLAEHLFKFDTVKYETSRDVEEVVGRTEGKRLRTDADAELLEMKMIQRLHQSFEERRERVVSLETIPQTIIQIQ